MIEDEVDAVAAALARAGGLSWYVGHEPGPLKLVMNRYRDRARLAIAALDRLRTGRPLTAPAPEMGEPSAIGAAADANDAVFDHIAAGSLVLYRPPGDRRTYLCRVGGVDGKRAYLVPELPACTGWVDVEHVSPSNVQ